MKKITLSLGLGALLLIALTTAHAAPLTAYDGFDGGTVFNGGSGWSGDWSGGISAGSNLTYGALTTTGVGANIGAYYNGTATRSFSSSVTTGTIWLSWVQNSSGSTDFNQIRLMNGSSNVVVVGTHGSDSNEFRLYNGNSDYTGHADTGISIVGTHFVALSIDLSNSTFNLYIDPTGLGSGAAPSSSVSSTYARGGTISSITGLQSVGSDNAFTWDEVRVGTTWADVSPVPEPSAMALTGLSLGAFAFLRRRRA